MSDTPQFPQSHRPELAGLLAANGWDAVVAFAAGFSERERVQLLSLATRIASGEQRASFNLDDLVRFNTQAIESALSAMAGYSAEPAEADWFKQQANVMAFNFAGDLAPCWPGDDEPRERRHYETGVEMGRRMIRWRIELDKKAENFALAYWALGIHQLGLGEHAEAADSFGKALDHSRLAAEEYGRATAVGPDRDWQVVLNSGYRGLAQALAGDSEGAERYRAALAAFSAMAEEHLELADEARFGIAQLEKTAHVFGLGTEPPAPSILRQQL